MAAHKLTKSFVDGLKPNEKDRIIFDAEVAGFGLRIKPSGAKTYLIQYRNASGQTRRLALGKCSVLPAEQARKLARQKLAEVAAGGDPSATRKQALDAPLVSDLANSFLTDYASQRGLSAAYVRDGRRYLDQFILPKLRSRPVAEVGVADIRQLLASLRKTPFQANRVRSLLSRMFSLAVEHGWRTDNPCAPVKPNYEAPSTRYLSSEEIGRLASALESHPNQVAADAVRLLLLTGARKTEVLSATWDMFDIDGLKWKKPSQHTKQRRMHEVPLSPEAGAVLSRLRELAEVEATYVFPGKVPGMPLKDIKRFWEDIREAAGLPGVRVHDLRHTVASLLVSSGVSLPVIGWLLGHTQPKTTARYAHLLDEPQRQALTQLGGDVGKLMAEAKLKVVPIRK